MLFASGLKFGRSKKNRMLKVDLSEEEQRKFIEDGERFGKELANKLANETGKMLYNYRNKHKKTFIQAKKFKDVQNHLFKNVQNLLYYIICFIVWM